MDSSLKQCVVIKFLVKLGEVSPTKIHQKLRSVYQEETMIAADVRRWVMRFKNGETSIGDKPRSGRPVSASAPQSIELVDQLTKQNRRIWVRNLSEKVGCPAGTIAKIVDHLNYGKMCEMWVHKLLTQQPKDVRRKSAALFSVNEGLRSAEENVFRGYSDWR